MIINQDINPEKQAYYLGAKVIEIVKDDARKELDVGGIFVTLNKAERVTYHAFTMAMSWLFLIGAIEQKGKDIVKCF